MSNKKLYKIRSVTKKDINIYLNSRNLEVNRKNSLYKKKITNKEHQIWWKTTKRKSYCLYLGKEKKLFFYEEKLFVINNTTYLNSGWFACSRNCNLSDIIYALNFQLKKKRNKTIWICIILKKNLLANKLTKFFKWKKLKKSSLISRIKKIYGKKKIIKNVYLYIKKY